MTENPSNCCVRRCSDAGRGGEDPNGLSSHPLKIGMPSLVTPSFWSEETCFPNLQRRIGTVVLDPVDVDYGVDVHIDSDFDFVGNIPAYAASVVHVLAALHHPG